MKKILKLFPIIFLITGGCTSLKAYPPVYGASICWQVFHYKNWNPLDTGLDGYAFYDCNTKKNILVGASTSSSLMSNIPSPVTGGAAQGAVESLQH